MFHFQLLFSISLANLFFLTLLQLTDSFWKPASETEAEAEEETPVLEQTTVTEDVDDDGNEESSEEAHVEDDNDDDDEESSPEAPVEYDNGDDDDEEFSPEAPVTEQEHVAASPATAQPTSSLESSGAKSRSSSPPAPAKNGSRAAVPKVPLSRVLGSTVSTAKPVGSTQSVIAARKRKLRSDGPVGCNIPKL